MAQINWILTHQIIVVRTITLAVELAVFGSECSLLEHKSKAETIVSTINIFSTIVCMVAILRFNKMVGSGIAQHKCVWKLLCLKSIVSLDVLQSLIFSVLSNHGDINPTAKLNLPDLLIGTQDFILCIECFIFSTLFILVYTARPYSKQNFDSHGDPGRKRNFAVAVFDSLNISDILAGIFYCFKAWTGRRSSGELPAYSQTDEPHAMGDVPKTTLSRAENRWDSLGHY